MDSHCIGAFIGGAISASIDAVSQVVIEKKSLKEVNWTSVKISAGEGAIAGAIGAATGGASLVASASKSVVKTAIKNVAIDAGVSFGSSVASQAVVKGKVNLSQAVSSAAMSAVSFVGGTAAKKVTAALKETNAVKAVSSVAGKVVDAGKTFVKENTNSVKLPTGKTVAPAKPIEAVKPKVTVTGKTNAQVSVGNKGGSTSIHPSNVNFSQRSVSGNVTNYIDDMKAGNWDWSKSGPLNVMKRDGQLVSYDNRRLLAAQEAGLESVPVNIVNANDNMANKAITWEDAFLKRFNDPRNIKLGGPVPNTGLKEQPLIIIKKGGK